MGNPQRAETLCALLQGKPLVSRACVNDFCEPSTGVLEISVHVYVKMYPRNGRAPTVTLFRDVGLLCDQLKLELLDKFSPIQDRTYYELQKTGVAKFYARNPYKFTIRERL